MVTIGFAFMAAMVLVEEALEEDGDSGSDVTSTMAQLTTTELFNTTELLQTVMP